LQHLLVGETNSHPSSQETQSSTEPQDSLTHSQQPNTVLHSEPNKMNPYFRSILIPSYSRRLYESRSLLPVVSWSKFYMHFYFSHSLHFYLIATIIFNEKYISWRFFVVLQFLHITLVSFPSSSSSASKYNEARNKQHKQIQC
jgi:hypothetical protein